MTEREPLVSVLQDGRRRFLDLVAEVRPDLHRYCARMTGSVADGEDIVQDTLARAYYALSEMDAMPPLRPWLFQIAHHRALDHLRRYERRMSEPLDIVAETASDPRDDPEDSLALNQATHAAISRFLELVPLQRSCVILKDVLGHSIEDIGNILGLSVPAVKAALHRGRERLQTLASAPRDSTPLVQAFSPGVSRYVALFQTRDWDGVRAMLAEDVRLDLVSRVQRVGRRDVSSYFSNYDKRYDWVLSPAIVDGREVVGVQRAKSNESDAYFYFVELSWAGDKITHIRDFRYVSYIGLEAEIQIPNKGPAPPSLR